jgi:malonyl-CoA O-methyltransferase
MEMLGKIGRVLRFGGDMLPAQDAYALWADTYPPRPHNPLMQAEQAVLEPTIALVAASLRRADPHSTRRALDLGTGTGRYIPLLQPVGVRLTVGVDLSMAMLARQADGHPRVCSDAVRLPFVDLAFDLVCSSLMAGDVQRLDSWLAEAARVLAPGGHLVYSDFHPSWAAERWRRTFRTADGRLIELPYFPHAIDDHLQLLERASLGVRTIREPRIQGRRGPVVVVFHAVKPRRPS